ncbi:MAG: pyridoxamine 5'-phosphate oxidase family protein [Chitinophagaceae bacterium]
MGKFFEAISESHREFIQAQHLFFVGTAPLEAEGHINLSPKGLDSFRILTPNRVAYMDIVGSGNETSAHILQNGRISFMFCAFEGAPSILRLYGKGYTVLPGNVSWDELAVHFTILPATRQIIVVDIITVQTSCRFGIPYYSYLGERDHAHKWAAEKGAEGLEAYKQEKNLLSIDGLPTALAQASGVSEQ